jgi:hypothetical protein
MGDPVYVTVDDRIPVGRTGSHQPISVKVPADGSLWLPIMEKAFAKLNGNYH